MNKTIFLTVFLMMSLMINAMPQGEEKPVSFRTPSIVSRGVTKNIKSCCDLSWSSQSFTEYY